jgi:hypothetical protein
MLLHIFVGNAEFGVAQPATTSAACVAQPAAPWPSGLRV